MHILAHSRIEKGHAEVEERLQKEHICTCLP